MSGRINSVDVISTFVGYERTDSRIDNRTDNRLDR